MSAIHCETNEEEKNTKQLKDPFSALEVMNLINIFPL